jgi:predicted DNA-binding transcriptional regulator YafY
MSRFLELLEVSRATFRRDLDYLRDRLGAPVIWDNDTNGYKLDSQTSVKTHPLPGLWLSEAEIHALLTGIELLSTLEPAPLIGTYSAAEAGLDANSTPALSAAAMIRISFLAIT